MIRKTYFSGYSFSSNTLHILLLARYTHNFFGYFTLGGDPEEDRPPALFLLEHLDFKGNIKGQFFLLCLVHT